MIWRRWAVEVRPLTGTDVDRLSASLARAAVIDPLPPFWTRRGAQRAADFHSSFLPVRCEVVRRG